MDNTLGSFSPYAGRLYIAYVGAGFYSSPAGVVDNTDIYLIASADDGTTWTAVTNPLTGTNQNRVNDDSPADGFSEGDRSQFEPSVAVDQTTGTLVVSYYDARFDASAGQAAGASANARVVTSLQTSIDGGNTFSPSVYLNTPKTATDAITGSTVTIEPIPGNQNLAGAQGFGDRQSLAVTGGRVYNLFSSNLNAAGANITTATVTIAGGPRVIASDMGPVTQNGSTGTYNTTFTADGTRQIDGFTVIFDRPVDPATFTPGLVTFKYQSPSAAAGTFVDLSNQVTSVQPLNMEDAAYTTFGPTTPTLTKATLSVGDSMVSRSDRAIATMYFPLIISEPQTTPVTVEYSTSDGVGANGAVQGIDYTAATGTVIIPAGQTSVLIAVSILPPPHLPPTPGPDLNFSLTITAPSVAFLVNRATSTGTILETPPSGQNYVSVGDAILNKGFSGTVNATFPVMLSTPALGGETVQFTTGDGTATTAEGDYQATSGTLTFVAGQTLAYITVPVNGDSNPEGDENFTVTLSNANSSSVPALVLDPAKNQGTGIIVDGSGHLGATAFLVHVVPQSAVGTYSYAVAPFVADRIRQPIVAGADSLSFNFPDTVTLAYNNVSAASALDNTSGNTTAAQLLAYLNTIPGLTAAGSVSVLGSPGGPFTISFPSGLDSTALSIAGTGSFGSAQLTTPRPTLDPSKGTAATYAASPTPLNMSVPRGNSANSTLTVSGVPVGQLVRDLTVTVTLNDPVPQDIRLILVAPDGTSIVLTNAAFLFTNPAASGNFLNTIFDDTAAQSISAASPPYRGRFRPVQALSTLVGQDPNFNGVDSTWTLQITNDDFSANSTSAVLVNWSLGIQTGTPISGSTGNFMDQNQNAVTADLIHAPNDIYSVPTPMGGVPFQLPYTSDTLPLVIPGPHVVDGTYSAAPEIVSFTAPSGTITLAFNGVQAQHPPWFTTPA